MICYVVSILSIEDEIGTVCHCAIPAFEFRWLVATFPPQPILVLQEAIGNDKTIIQTLDHLIQLYLGDSASKSVVE